MEKKPTPEQRKDRNVVRTTRRNLGIINGHLRGRLIYPKYGGGAGNVKQED
jgi:hypothetical protein